MFRKVGIFILAFLFFSGCASVAGYDGRADDEALKTYIRELCATYQIPEMLVFAVIEKESSWNANAVNYNETCFGLMQINTINFAWLQEELGLDNPKDPYQNVQAGIYMLSSYIEKYIDYHMALMCYNCGESGARQLWEEGIFTNDYSCWVMDRMHDLEWEALDAARDALYLQRQMASVSPVGSVIKAGDTTLPPAGAAQDEPLNPTKEKQFIAKNPVSSSKLDTSQWILYTEDAVSAGIYERAGTVTEGEDHSVPNILFACLAYFEKEPCLFSPDGHIHVLSMS